MSSYSICVFLQQCVTETLACVYTCARLHARVHACTRTLNPGPRNTQNYGERAPNSRRNASTWRGPDKCCIFCSNYMSGLTPAHTHMRTHAHTLSSTNLIPSNQEFSSKRNHWERQQVLRYFDASVLCVCARACVRVHVCWISFTALLQRCATCRKLVNARTFLQTNCAAFFTDICRLCFVIKVRWLIS